MASMKGKLSGHDEPDRIKGPWSPEEDAALQHFVEKYGPRNWSLISKAIPGRSGKSCRLRWCNQLSPQVEHRPFTPEEDATIVRAHAQHGNKWATIARMLSGRTDNAIKNHWNSTLRRRCQGGGALVIDDEITSGDGFRKRNLSDDAEASRKFKKLSLGTTTTTTTTEPCSSSASDRSDSSLVFGSPHIYRPVPRAAPLALSNEANLNLNHHEASCSSTDPPTSLCLSLPGTDVVRDAPVRPTVVLNTLPPPVASSPVAPPGYIKTEEAMEWMSSAINSALTQMLSPIIAPTQSHGVMPETLGSSGLLTVMQEMVAKEVRDYMSSVQHRNSNNTDFRGCVASPPPMGMRVSNSNALG